MTTEQFNRLDRDKQLDYVMKFGILLIECKRFKFALRLFQLHHLYVEVYSTEKRGEIVSINAFEDVDDLEPYLSTIDISEVMQG